MKHINIRITGKVQGVFYRKNTVQQALRLNIKGFVQNQPDGSVYAEAAGSGEALDQFINWCKNGPDQAEVTEVKTENGERKNFEEFIIKR